MNWEHIIITSLLGIIIVLVAYFIGRHYMGKTGEEFFFDRLMCEPWVETDKEIQETLSICLKYFKQWNHLRRFL